MVLQKNTLFSGTVKDNLRWGRETATEQEIEEACRIACVDEFIDRWSGDMKQSWAREASMCRADRSRDSALPGPS